MRKQTGYLISVMMFLVGIFLGYFGLRRNIPVYINGKQVSIGTFAFTPGGVLRSGGIIIGPKDRVQPNVENWLDWQYPAIRYDRAVSVHIWSNGKDVTFLSADRIPGNLLMQAGIRLFPGDRILWNGLPVASDSALPGMGAYFIQYKPAIEVFLVKDGQELRFRSSQATLGQVLAEQGIILSAGDSLSQPLDTPLSEDLTVILRSGRSLVIRIGDNKIKAKSAAATIGQALAEAGVSLQGLDYSIPDGDQPLPADGNVKVFRVREDLILEQKEIAFKTEYITDPNLNMNEQKVLEQGQNGVQVSRLRVRYENGVETGRAIEGVLTTKASQPQKITVGAKVNPGTLPSDGGSIDYWRAVTVYATSYSPCRSGASRCYNYTASGAIAQKGIIGVTSAWYKQLAGLKVYIPGYGYGVIGDIGGGIPGKNWIDLAYSDSDYVGWSENVTMYFLNPAPAVIPSVP